jgi:hypothetical protein
MIRRIDHALILLPFMLILAAALFFWQVRRAAGFTTVEQEVYRYSSGALLAETAPHKRAPLTIPADLRGPIEFAAVQPAQARKVGMPNLHGVSFILISEAGRRAIIDGNVLRLGESIYGMQVSAIEKERVAITSNGVTTWLRLEKSK